jgi:hypothetical protein
MRVALVSIPGMAQFIFNDNCPCPPPRTFRQSDVRRLTGTHVTPGSGWSESGRTEIFKPKEKGKRVSDGDVCRHREQTRVLMAI